MTTVETQDNAAIARDLYNAFNDHDLDRAAAMVSEDFELVDFAADGQTSSLPTARLFAAPKAFANGFKSS